MALQEASRGLLGWSFRRHSLVRHLTSRELPIMPMTFSWSRRYFVENARLISTVISPPLNSYLKCLFRVNTNHKER
ncbi:UNVERIFIED_CONTAM: hypothetical protein GTU68_029344 [Idotea baltica]|nr:hypothetical protein [Idotea baltica]